MMAFEWCLPVAVPVLLPGLYIEYYLNTIGFLLKVLGYAVAMHSLSMQSPEKRAKLPFGDYPVAKPLLEF
jgi:hypothetical protein